MENNRLMIGLLESFHYLGKSSEEVLQMALKGEITLHYHINETPEVTRILQEIHADLPSDIDTSISHKYKMVGTCDLSKEQIEKIVHDGFVDITLEHEHFTNCDSTFRLKEGRHNIVIPTATRYRITMEDVFFVNPEEERLLRKEELKKVSTLGKRSKETNYGWQREFVLENARNLWEENSRTSKANMASKIEQLLKDHFKNYPAQHMTKNNKPAKMMEHSGILRTLREHFPDK